MVVETAAGDRLEDNIIQWEDCITLLLSWSVRQRLWRRRWEPRWEFSDVTERPIIFYDQLGCGRSERPSNPSLWTVEKFRDRLSQVIAALSLTEFHLWGHSWGTTLALAYAATQPKGLLSISLNSPIVDVPSYRADLQDLLQTLPQDIQDGINHNEPDSQQYLEALSTFYRHFLHRADPWPGCMQYHKAVANSKVTIFQNSSHSYFDEERAEYMLALRNFILKHEKTNILASSTQ